MRIPQSKIGLILSIIYILVSVFLILSQGLFGESFIAIVLGMPWQYFIVYLNLQSAVSSTSSLFPVFLYTWVLAPIVLNIILLYWIGAGIANQNTEG